MADWILHFFGASDSSIGHQTRQKKEKYKAGQAMQKAFGSENARVHNLKMPSNGEVAC